MDGDSNNYKDELGHGTHVAATIAGRLKCGIAPEAMILPIKVLDKSGLLWFGEWLVQALEYVYQWRDPYGNPG